MRYLVLLVFMIFGNSLFSQSIDYSDRMSYGVFGNFSINSHEAEFSKIPDCPSCSPGYRSGDGTGLAFGLLFEYRLNDLFVPSIRATYHNISGLLTANEETTIIVNGSATTGIMEHSIDSKLASVGLEPQLKINPIDNLFVNIGLHIGYLLQKDYSQKEELTQPLGTGTFADEFGNDSHSRIRNVSSGELSKAANIFASPFIGVSYEMPLNSDKTLLIEPEISYFYGLTNVVNDNLVGKWTVNSLRTGVALKYSPMTDKPLIREEYELREFIDTISVTKDIIASMIFIGKPQSSKEIIASKSVRKTIETISRTDTLFIPKIYQIVSNISAFGVDDQGQEIPNPTFKIEEFVSNRLDPLLNYVFFDDNTSTIPSRYKILNSNNRIGFDIDSLYELTTLQIYYNILNIIGKRLEQFPKASMTLTGCNSDVGNEKGKKDLSQQRAEIVKKYLVDVWDIAESRISIQSRNLPLKASTPLIEPEKIEENRRVEIASDDYRITEPVYIQNIQRTSNPPKIRFKPEIVAEAGIGKWQISASQQKDNILFDSTGNGEPSAEIDWLLESNQLSIPSLKMPLHYTLAAMDNRGTKAISNDKFISIDVISISQKRSMKIEDYEIEKFSLILFDFDNADILGNNKKITELIKGRMKAESDVTIKGFTDRTGDDTYNQKLSERRAANAKSSIGKKEALSTGEGEKILLYNNDLPEGRFYCRTVEITVKTKVTD